MVCAIAYMYVLRPTACSSHTNILANDAKMHIFKDVCVCVCVHGTPPLLPTHTLSMQYASLRAVPSWLENYLHALFHVYASHTIPENADFGTILNTLYFDNIPTHTFLLVFLILLGY